MTSHNAGFAYAFARYVLRLPLHTREVMCALLVEPRRLAFGMAGILALTLVYITGISLALLRHPGMMPLQTPLLRIAPERYYFYELGFLFPVALISVVVQAGVAHLVCRIRSSHGSFDDLFALTGFSYIVVALIIGIPDLVLGFFGPPVSIGPHVMIGTVCFCVLSVYAVRISEAVSWWIAASAGALGLLANGGLEFTFMR